MRGLIEKILFTEDKEGPTEKISKKAKATGIFLASSQRLYQEFAEGRVEGFTVPAINIRTLTFDIARAVFRAAQQEQAGPFIFEIAKSEISYTQQSPSEYVSVIMAAAIREGFTGPLFFQADHFKVEPENYQHFQKKERASLVTLLKNALKAGFYNIDIDGSNLKDISANASLTAAMTDCIRKLKVGTTVSIGGEVGEIGGTDTTLEDVDSYLKGYNDYLKEFNLDSREGIIKLAVQARTAHGGRIMPDGKIAPVAEDFPLLKKLSQKARSYGLAGIVQHGASTLAKEHFSSFPQSGVIEIHLATGFQNIVYESSYFPESLRDKIYQWLIDNFPEERKKYQTDVQFFYKTRKKALGPFKKGIYNIGQRNRDKIAQALEEEFRFFFKALNLSGRRVIMEDLYQRG